MSFSPRPSPFKRPESPMTRSPSTVRGATPPTSPTKTFPLSARASSPMLSPERQSPFVRRPSQLGSEQSRSPFTRPSSRLSVTDTPGSPSQTPSYDEPGVDPFVANSPSPTIIEPYSQLGGTPSSPPSMMSPSPSRPAASAAGPRPAIQRTLTSSTSQTVRPINLQPSQAPKQRPAFAPSIGGYNHVPQPLLRSMRESFEVLDSSNSGTITSASVSSMLEQLGMDNSPAALSAFFPPHTPATLNLARFLDTLSGPMADLSHPDELTAAFGAFDVDDSGQIDMGELRDALLHTGLDDGGRMNERAVDGILGEFVGRRAFGGKGVLGKDLAMGGKGRGEVFRYRDFMGNISGAGVGEPGGVAA